MVFTASIEGRAGLRQDPEGVEVASVDSEGEGGGASHGAPEVHPALRQPHHLGHVPRHDGLPHEELVIP